jgi:hypothetical protein
MANGEIFRIASMTKPVTPAAREVPKRGVSVIFLSQDLPFYNATTMDAMRRFEHLLYANLQ